MECALHILFIDEVLYSYQKREPRDTGPWEGEMADLLEGLGWAITDWQAQLEALLLVD